MRRLVVSVIAASGLVLIGAGTASAEPVPGAGAAQATAGQKLCKITDDRLVELSGIVATDDGFIVINDSSQQSGLERVFFLNDKCKVVDSVSYSGDGPLDTEDLAVSPDGTTLWIADIGDNDKQRRTVALWSMPIDGSEKPKIHRLAYPDGPHDAEALLINGDGTPIIVTKDVGGPAGVYTPAAKLKTGNVEGVPMRKAGQIVVPPSDTSGNVIARLGRGAIDGGAVAPGGAKVVLRTYTDALEWKVTGGDVLGAIKNAPLVTPLPDEPYGEAITYSPDGKYFLTVSDMGSVQEETDNFLLRYTPVVTAAATKAAAADGTDDSGGQSWYDRLSINDITYIVGGVGVVGAILVGFGIFGIMRARKRPLDPIGKGDGDPETAAASTELLTVGGTASGRGSGVYGGGSRPPQSPGGVYGGTPAGPSRGGPGVYGSSGSGGGNPGQPTGRPGQGGGQPVGRPGPVDRPGAGAGQHSARPGQGGHPGGPGQGGHPGGPGQGGHPGGPGQGGQPGGPGQGGHPGGPGQGGHPGGPGQGGHPGGPPGHGSGGRHGGGGGGGVYGAPPAHPQSAGRGNPGGAGQRPSAFFGPGAGHHSDYPDSGRPTPTGMADYADSQGRGRDFDNPGYGRAPYGRQ